MASSRCCITSSRPTGVSGMVVGQADCSVSTALLTASFVVGLYMGAARERDRHLRR
jgi:hypothetical protein